MTFYGSINTEGGKMAKVFSFQGAKKIVFGQGAVENLPAEIEALHGKRVLFVLDRGLKDVGVAEKVIDVAQRKGIYAVTYDQVTPEPAPSLADAAAALAKERGCDLVVGVGGGSSLDVAKASAMLVKNGGKAEQYIGLETVPERGLPTILIPTTAGTGSEVTFTAVFTMRDKKRKGGINSRFLYPDVALLDPSLTETLPPGPTATTGADALTHAIEGYTSLQGNPMSDLVAREAIRLIGANLGRAVRNGKDREARSNMLLASLMAGLALASAGVGACHALAYPLGAFFDVPHGLANAVLLPYIMEFNLHAAETKYASVATLMDPALSGNRGEVLALASVDIVRTLTQGVGIPQTLTALKIPETAVSDMADMAMTVARPLANNPREVTKEQAMKIYKRAF
jgi:alcohol dehydrogenase class IV